MKAVSLPTAARQHRTGMVLVLVLVVVMVLSFAIYSFSKLMVTEFAATATGLTHLQRRELASSGIELAAFAIRHETQSDGQLDSSMSLRQPINVQLPNGQVGIITLLRQLPVDGQSALFGLNDECAKLNLNTLPLKPSERPAARQRLLALPGITVQIADAILDWMDPDDDVSEFGAETSWYTAQSPPRRPRQGPFQRLEELLQVRGITPELLYGEDQNGNGILDTEENDGNRRFPADNSDGVLQQGFSQYITVTSRETNLLANGKRRIQLNQPVLARLYDQLEPILGSQAAEYIVAWRMRGATYADQPAAAEDPDQEQLRLQRIESAQKRLQAQLGNVDGGRSELTADQTQRGGLRLTAASSDFQSLVDLFGGEVRIVIDGKDTLLASPWPGDPATVRRLLPLFQRIMTVTEGTATAGRISINQAPLPVLKTVPGMTDSLARAIVSAQQEIVRSGAGEFESVAWLVTRGLLSLAQLREMAPWITTGGSVRGGIAVGQTQNDVPAAAMQFLLDCSGPAPQVLFIRDL